MQPFSITERINMTYCKNCHKMSKDDDFCSHCGAAVWGDDCISNDAPIQCDLLDGHTHDKVTYDKSERGEGVHIPEGYKPYNPTNQRPNIQDRSGSQNNAKLAKNIATIIKIIFFLIFAGAFLDTFIGFFKHF